MMQSDVELTVTFSKEIVHVGGDLVPAASSCDRDSLLRFVGEDGESRCCCWLVVSSRGRKSGIDRTVVMKEIVVVVKT